MMRRPPGPSDPSPLPDIPGSHEPGCTCTLSPGAESPVDMYFWQKAPQRLQLIRKFIRGDLCHAQNTAQWTCCQFVMQRYDTSENFVFCLFFQHYMAPLLPNPDKTEFLQSFDSLFPRNTWQFRHAWGLQKWSARARKSPQTETLPGKDRLPLEDSRPLLPQFIPDLPFLPRDSLPHTDCFPGEPLLLKSLFYP